MGTEAQPLIEQALAAMGIETRLGVSVAAIDEEGVTLSSGERMPSLCLVWCAGMRANPLTQAFAVDHDRFGRLPVDKFLRVTGVPGAFACGDGAAAMISEGHASVMSCQHARPMGRFAGHNAVCDLLGLPMLALSVDWYVTVLDLGPDNAVYTEGWDRHVVATGQVAKRTKQTINCQRIYPPAMRDRGDILAAAVPVVDRPPTYER
jgi:NADH dehydrogenase